MQQLLDLLSGLDTLGSKKRVIGCLLVVVERSGTRVCENLDIAVERGADELGNPDRSAHGRNSPANTDTL